MTKNEAIRKLNELDDAYTEKMREGQFWAREYHLAGTASPYRKASEKPVLEGLIQKAADDREAIWAKMVELMDAYGIDALSELV